MTATQIFPLLYPHFRRIVDDHPGDRGARDSAAHAAMVLDEDAFHEVLGSEHTLESELHRMLDRAGVRPDDARRDAMVAAAAAELRLAGWGRK